MVKRRSFIQSGILGLGAILAASKSSAQSPGTTEMTKKIRGIFVVAPSVVKAGESFDISIKMLTDPFHVPLNAFTRDYPTVSSSTSFSFRFFHGAGKKGWHYESEVPLNWPGTLKITSDSNYSGPSEFSFKNGPYPHDKRPIGKVGPIKFTRAGIHYVTFKDPVSGAEQISNPIYVKAAEEQCQNLYWGDIHGHTILTDGVRSPEEYYYFGRDEAFLDICALSDHPEFYLTDYMWNYFTEVTNGFNEPGRFVTLQGFEWTNFQLGHRCLYFPSDKVPCIRATDPKYSTVTAMQKFAKEHGGISIPHHPASKQFPLQWTDDIDDEVERLVEVYSLWGTSEKPVGPNDIRTIGGGEAPGCFYVDAMKKKFKFGLMCSSDMHVGQPGDAIQFRQGKRLYGGLMGVWADRLDRASVFDAMWNRRVYGTTGTRTVLRFSVNDKPMGSTIKGTGLMRFKVHAIAEVPVTKIEIVKNGVEYKILEPNENEVNWDFTAPVDSSSSYYVRVTRQDEELAWSSPIWFES